MLTVCSAGSCRSPSYALLRLRRGIGGNRQLRQWGQGTRRRWGISGWVEGVGKTTPRDHQDNTCSNGVSHLVKERRSMDAADLNTWKMYKYPVHTACGYSTNI